MQKPKKKKPEMKRAASAAVGGKRTKKASKSSYMSNLDPISIDGPQAKDTIQEPA